MRLPFLKRVLFDTSACIYFLDGARHDPRHRTMARLDKRVESAGLTVLLSPITVAELLVLPMRTSDIEAEAAVRLFVSKLCKVMPATAATASSAAVIRSTYGLRLPDAFILATAAEHSVDAVVGNDAAWKRVIAIRYVHLDDEEGS